MLPKEQKERIKKSLLVLRTSPDVFNRCLALLDEHRGVEAVIENLGHSSEANETRAGIYLTACLLEVADDEDSDNVKNFADALWKIITGSSDESLLKLASRAAVYSIQRSKAHAAELMDNFLGQCLEMLQESKRNEQHRMAATILAWDLANNPYSASHFFQRATQFFNNIFKVIRDPSPNVRKSAARALHAALAVISRREAKHKNEWYKHCFEQACQKVGSLSKDDSLHSSLLIFNELLRIANADAERTLLGIMHIAGGGEGRLDGGRNKRKALESLLQPSHPIAAESRTARALVTEHYFAEHWDRFLRSRTPSIAYFDFAQVDLNEV